MFLAAAKPATTFAAGIALLNKSINSLSPLGINNTVGAVLSTVTLKSLDRLAMLGVVP